MRGIEGHHARRNGIRFNGLIDGGKNDALFCDVNNHAASRKIGDDFVFTALGKRVSWEKAEE